MKSGYKLTKINMTEGYHRGTSKDWNMPKSPSAADVINSLQYPLTVNLADGTKIVFQCYKDHHEFIKNLFLNK